MFVDRSRWWGWGDPGVRTPLEARPDLWSYLQKRLGLESARGLPVPELEQVKLPSSRLDDALRQELERAVAGDGGTLDTAHEGRVRHCAGKSYLDLVRLRAGKVEAAPDAILHPTSPAAVARILAIAAERDVAVVPFGGGTSVVGGVHPGREGKRAVVTLDTRGLDKLVRVDAKSLTATAESGIMGPALEAALAKHGLSLGHFPQSFEFSTLGGWIAARSAGQCSTGYGRIEELVHALDVALPGRSLETAPPVPSATGPNLRELFVGSEGVLGVITRSTVRVRPIPEARLLESAFFKSWSEGLEAARELAQVGPKPTMIRLSDPQETEMLLAAAPPAHGFLKQLTRKLGMWVLSRRAGRAAPGCVMIMDFEGPAASARQQKQKARAVLAKRALLLAGDGPAKSWFTERFRHPYLRDELMSRGVMVETLETATTWDKLEELYRGVREALAKAMEAAGTPGLVLCHLSHTYAQGASLYFTAMARAIPGEEIAQWQKVKTAATGEIARQKAALSHHHGIGMDHKPWMAALHGDEGVKLMAALKRELDPAGVLNPGKLI